jgi:hypothetical protein
MNDAIMEAVKARQPTYPPEQSMGGVNSYNFACKPVGYSPGYCVCLHKIAAFERDGDLTSYPECGKAIRNKDCPALKLRAEEREAGRALYFIDRAILREEMDKHFAATTPSFRTTSKPAAPASKSEPTKTTAKKVADHLTTMPTPEIDGYAAAINAAIAALPADEKKEEPKVVVPSPSVAKAPSLVDMVRMQMGKSSGT